MTKKEIFDKVAAHLLAQGEKSERHGKCVYRSPEGLKCAVGCLIPDELYNEGIEGMSVGDCFDPIDEEVSKLREVLMQSGIPDEYTIWSMLQDFQTIHDYNDPRRWEEAIDRFRSRIFRTEQQEVE